MINFLNRVELFVDSNQEAAAKVWSTLQANGIEYEVMTKGNVPTFLRRLHDNMAIAEGMGNLPASWYADEMNFIYIVYVKKKDLARAKELCSLE